MFLCDRLFFITILTKKYSSQIIVEEDSVYDE